MFRLQKGFTLVELMLVVFVIGILAAIAIPNFIAMQERAREGSTRANMRAVQLAVEDAGVRNDGLYPAELVQITDYLPKDLSNPYSSYDQRVELEVGDISVVPTSIWRGVVHVTVSPDRCAYRIYGGNHEGKPFEKFVLHEVQ